MRKNSNLIIDQFLYNKFINLLIKKGYKSSSEKIFRNFVKSFYKASSKKACFVLKHCIKTNSMFLNTKLQKRGRVVFKEIPYFLKNKIRLSYAIKNFKKQTFYFKKIDVIDKMLHVMYNILTKPSSEISQKHILTKQALKEKSQAHFRWFF